MIRSIRFLAALLVLIAPSLIGRETLLEFKAAAFLPTDRCLKNIYGRAAGIYGPEVTVQLSEKNEHWYAFASADFLTKKGHSIGLCTPTTMYLIPLSLGVKYFVPFCYGNLYAGLGFQPVYLKTVQCASNSIQKTSDWGFGGIAKIGSYVDLPHNFFLDPFVAYSFAKVSTPSCANTCIKSSAVKVNGVVLGLGLGYQFN